MRAAFFLNLSFTLVELVGGLWTNSFAVLSDALHDLGDCLVLGTAWYLQRVALKGRDAHYSYGYARYSMLGGWGSAMVLLPGSLLVAGAAVPRLLRPPLPHTQGMMALAVFGLVMNGAAAWMLHRGSSLNERGAYLHLLEDVLGWAAVLVGAVAMYFTRWAVIDPLLSMAISAFIAVNALRTLRAGTGILMQRLPEHVDAERIQRVLQLQATTTDKRRYCAQVKRCIWQQQFGWLPNWKIAAADVAGQNQRLRPRPRLRPRLRLRLRDSRGPQRDRRRCQVQAHVRPCDGELKSVVVKLLCSRPRLISSQSSASRCSLGVSHVFFLFSPRPLVAPVAW